MTKKRKLLLLGGANGVDLLSWKIVARDDVASPPRREVAAQRPRHCGGSGLQTVVMPDALAEASATAGNAVQGPGLMAAREVTDPQSGELVSLLYSYYYYLRVCYMSDLFGFFMLASQFLIPMVTPLGGSMRLRSFHLLGPRCPIFRTRP